MLLLIVATSISMLISGSTAQTFCGVKQPLEDKTCISIRLPWQEDPIYFCTEKENIQYKDRCSNQLAKYCPSAGSNTSLQIATPWDCCALVSTPDYCSEVSCPAAPYNRTCTEVQPDPSKPWDCCPSYFCDEGPMTSCPMKRLQAGCLSPPKDKANCTAFKDEHSCCNKYQCAGEVKPGMCPMEVQGMKFKRMIENLNTSSLIKNDTTSIDSKDQSSPPSPTRSVSAPGVYRNRVPITTDVSCVGDFTCPGQMKCCSPHMSSYYGSTNKMYGGHFRRGRDDVIRGYCQEPAMVDVDA